MQIFIVCPGRVDLTSIFNLHTNGLTIYMILPDPLRQQADFQLEEKLSYSGVG